MKHHLFFLALLLASASASLKITLCSDRGCRAPPLSTLVVDAPSGCQTAFAGLVQTVKVAQIQPAKGEQEETPETKLAARFYRSTDCFAHCGTSHLITQLSNGSALTSPGPVTPAHSLMQSFEVVALDANGFYEPHGYCGLRHGDAAFFRGRAWKWWQIGRHARSREALFKEVPFEDWDDAVHSRLEGAEYERHGAVDSMGKFKWEQYARGKWGGVPLERWDEDVNVRNDEEFDMASLDEGLVEGVKKRAAELRAKHRLARRGEL
jgi:hypothetical protein